MRGMVGAVKLHIVAAQHESIGSVDILEQGSQRSGLGLRPGVGGAERTPQAKNATASLRIYLSFRECWLRDLDEADPLDLPRAAAAAHIHGGVRRRLERCAIDGQDLVAPDEIHGRGVARERDARIDNFHADP